jgi:hypothetical protein
VYSSTERVAKQREQVSQAPRSCQVLMAIAHGAYLISAHCCVPLCFDAGSAAPGSGSQADGVMACSSCPPVCIAGLVACAYCCCREPWQVERVGERRAGNESQAVRFMCVSWSYVLVDDCCFM